MTTLIKQNKTLKRLLNKYLSTHALSPDVDFFIQAINETFNHYERDRELLERALDLTSSELTLANETIREEKRIVQERLTESQQILKSINNNLSEAVIRTTSTGELIYTNSAFNSLFENKDDISLLHLNFKNFFLEKEVWKDIKQKLDTNGFIKNVEILFKKPNGTSFWGLVSLVNSLGNSDEVFFDGSIVNINIQKQSEEDLRHANLLLVRTNEELDSFVYSVSHDLKAPLSSMLGLINLMTQEKPENLGIYLDKMRSSIKKLDVFIKDIIDYSYNTRKTASVEEISLKSIFEESHEQYKYLPNADFVAVHTNWNQTTPFYSDQRRLKIIFNNIISNAINYCNPQAEKSFIRISTETVDDSILIIFEDNGIGIGSEHLNKVFEMFYRATDLSAGSGLGLYIVKEAVQKLNGIINVTSTLNVGTTFKIQIPYYSVL